MEIKNDLETKIGVINRLLQLSIKDVLDESYSDFEIKDASTELTKSLRFEFISSKNGIVFTIVYDHRNELIDLTLRQIQNNSWFSLLYYANKKGYQIEKYDIRYMNGDFERRVGRALENFRELVKTDLYKVVNGELWLDGYYYSW